MITFDYLTLKSFYEETKNFFKGARLQKIQQPTRRDFIFTLRAFGETKKLYINIDPQIYHMCFVTEKSFNKRFISIPKKPPMFCMLLRKYLEGFKITEIKVPQYERIFEIYFESYNELNEKIKLCLAIEFMGRYSNIILYNTDTNIIIGCAHNVGSEKSRQRELAGTFPYIYPQKQQKQDILLYNGLIDYETLNSSFMGISKAFQNQLKSNKINLDKIKRFVSLDYPLSPAYNEKEFSIYSELIQKPNVCNSVNEMIDLYFTLQQNTILTKTLKLKLKNIVSPKLKKQRLLCEKLQSQIKKKDNASKYKKFADLIMANLYNNMDFEQEITLNDWTDNTLIKIPLDKDLSLKQNAQKYYKLYSKSKDSIEQLKDLYQKACTDKVYYSGLLHSIDFSDNLSDLYDILDECEDMGLIKNIQQVKRKVIDILKTEINDHIVYIGKNNKQNDYLISKIADPNDIWFHVQNATGSHILLKNQTNKEPNEETIYKCAKLAKRYSSAALDIKAGVIYTRRKYLKKPPNTNPGYVTYKNEKEIIVD